MASSSSSSSSCLSAISRIWLVLVNILFLAISLLSFIVAAGILNLSNSSVSVPNGGVFIQSMDMRGVAIALMILGSFLGITSLTGCFGGLCRLSSFLTFYIGAIVLNIFLLAGGGFYAIYKAVERKNSWSSLTLNEWNGLVPNAKDFVQQAFVCCGYASGDDSAFTGQSTNFWNTTVVPTNACVSGNVLIGCYAAGNLVFQYFVNVVVTATILGLITCTISAIAANAARKRKALIEGGFLRTKPSSSNYKSL